MHTSSIQAICTRALEIIAATLDRNELLLMRLHREKCSCDGEACFPSEEEEGDVSFIVTVASELHAMIESVVDAPLALQMVRKFLLSYVEEESLDAVLDDGRRLLRIATAEGEERGN